MEPNLRIGSSCRLEDTTGNIRYGTPTTRTPSNTIGDSKTEGRWSRLGWNVLNPRSRNQITVTERTMHISQICASFRTTIELVASEPKALCITFRALPRGYCVLKFFVGEGTNKVRIRLVTRCINNLLMRNEQDFRAERWAFIKISV